MTNERYSAPANYFSITDMQHRLTDKAPIQETPRDLPNLRPGSLNFDLRAQAAIGDETAQASQAL